MAVNFASPSLSIASPSLPGTVCANDGTTMDLQISTVGALDGSYAATLTIAGPDGGSRILPIQILISGLLLPDLSANYPGGGVSVVPDSSPVFPLSGEGFTIHAGVKNVGPTASGTFSVNFFEGENLLGSVPMSGLAVGQGANVELAVPAGLADGYYLVRAEVVSPAEGELELANNTSGALLQVGTPPVTDAFVEVFASITPNCDLLSGTLNVHANYKLVSSTTTTGPEGPETHTSVVRYPVQGGWIDAQIVGTAFGVSGAHTDVNGNYSASIGLPPEGVYSVEVEVTDFTVTGSNTVTLIVPAEPDCDQGGVPHEPGPPDPHYPVTNVDLYVCSTDIEFLDTAGINPIPMPTIPGASIQVSARVHYYSSVGSPLNGQPVHFTARRQLNGDVEEEFIGTGLANFAGGGETLVSMPWTVPEDGTYTILVSLDPSVSQSVYNDQATRALVSGTPPEPDTVMSVSAEGAGCGGIHQWVSGRALYASDGTRSLADICGVVSITAYDQNDNVVGTKGGYMTDLAGNFYFHPHINLPVGVNRMVVEVTDGTLTGYAEFTIECFGTQNRPAPDVPQDAPQDEGDLYVFSEHLGFLEKDCITGLRRSPLPDEEISIAADLHYWDMNSGLPLTNIPAQINVLIPDGNDLLTVPVGTTNVSFPFGGGSSIICVPWTPAVLGPQIVQVIINPDAEPLPFAEYTGNNAATKLIYVGALDCLLTAAPDEAEVFLGDSAQFVISGEVLSERTPTLSMNLVADTPDLPPGVSFAFSETQLTLPGETVLTLNTTAATPPGVYYFNVIGTGDNCTAVARVRLKVIGDVTPPVITLLGDNPFFVECPDAFNDPGATAEDDYDGDVTDRIQVDGIVDSHVLGDYIVTYSVADLAGNSSSTTRTVTVQDTTPPDLVCPEPTVLAADPNCQAPIPDLSAGAVVSDNCSPPAGITVEQDPAPGTMVGLGTNAVVLTATDEAGNAAECVAIVVVVDQTPPVITCPGDIQVVADIHCKAPIPDLAAQTIAADCNGPVLIAQNPAAGTVLGLGSHAVIITATDAAGNAAGCEVMVTIVDETAPVLSCAATADVDADESCGALVPDLAAAAVATDCNGPVILTQIPSAGTPVGLGTHVVQITATDAAGNSASCFVDLTVHDVTPPNVTITAPASGYLSPVHETVLFEGSFTDCDPSSGFTAQWTFGSATVPSAVYAGTVNGTTVTDAFAIDEPGVYSVHLAVTDPSGNTGEDDTVLDDLPAYVVVYDPSGGFVTGGGWFWSPPGALHPGLSELMEVEGKASFGFVSKYKKGANVPTGQTEFQFKAGNLNFHSDTYEWLVVSGARAQFKGSGFLNGVSGYHFILTATDSAVNGSGDTDKFRIKIWDPVVDEIIYDNQFGSEDDEELNALTIIEGGNIVIHKPRGK
jgi:hypothetical protein